MAITYLKKSPKTSSTDDSKTAEIVKNLLKEIEVSKSKLLPGLKSTAIVKPIVIAIAVVVKYKPSVLPAILPKLKFWSKEETPLVKEKKTNGTTISFNKEIKTWPPIYKKPSIK